MISWACTSSIPPIGAAKARTAGKSQDRFPDREFADFGNSFSYVPSTK
jgi:hypothetical protein